MTSNPNFGAEFMDKYILLRRELYADVGLTVVQLSADIRAKLKIDVDHGGRPKESLLSSKTHIWRIKSRGELRRMERKAEIKMRAKKIKSEFICNKSDQLYTGHKSIFNHYMELLS
jgi:hypothetical protein